MSAMDAETSRTSHALWTAPERRRACFITCVITLLVELTPSCRRYSAPKRPEGFDNQLGLRESTLKLQCSQLQGGQSLGSPHSYRGGGVKPVPNHDRALVSHSLW